MNDIWLQGGPFLEISFFIENKYDSPKEILNTILGKINEINPKVEIFETKDNLKNKLLEFEKGYLYDENNKDSVLMHFLSLNVYVNSKRKRKAYLDLSLSSKDKAIFASFIFYASTFDVPEWNQIGVNQEEIVELKDFFINLFELYNFPLGTMGYEMNVTYLFSSEKDYPEELIYELDKLSISEIIGNHLNEYEMYDYLIVNKNYRDLSNYQFKEVIKVKNGYLVDNYRPLAFI